MIAVFDRAQIKRQRARVANTAPENFFLFHWANKQIEESLSFLQRRFPFCIQLGTRGGLCPLPANIHVDHHVMIDCTAEGRPDIVCEDDFLPLQEQSIDLFVSSLSLHTINDLPGALLQIRKSLKPDGFFIASMFGGETLHELRTCLSEAELEITGGITPRVSPFADKQQMGALLQRAGYNLPVVDSEIITVTYQSLFHLMRDLRNMGEGNAIAERSKTFTSRRIFMRAAEIYAQKFAEEDGRIIASFEIIFLHGWAPADNQQKPLRPGSGETRLADYLGAKEISIGDEKP